VSYLILKIEKTISAIKNVKPGIVVSTAATKDGDPSLIDFWAKAKAIKLVISIKTNNLMEELKSPPLVPKVDLTLLKTSPDHNYATCHQCETDNKGTLIVD